MKRGLKAIISILTCLSAGFIGSFFTSPNISIWYASLQKPEFNPPNSVFAPVWTILYILMGISLFLVWKEGWENKNVRTSMGIFGVQLLLNIAWSGLFFGLQNPFYALIEILILWFAIFLTILKFYNINKVASILLIPYILWVSFASVLNYFIWVLN